MVVLSLLLPNACAPALDPSEVEALTSGVWHARIGDEDYVYELTHENGVLGGRVHRVIAGKQMDEIPLTEVSLHGASIEFGHGRFPSYQGEVDLESGRIEGGVPHERRFSEMDLTRAERSAWPMLWPRFGPAKERGSYVWTRPEELADGWQVASPSDVGLDRQAVEATVRAILDGEAGALHSFLVARDGRIVVEEYFHGWGRDDLHEVLSCTKSVASLLAGIAIDQGHLSGVGAPLLDSFPGYREHADPGWDQVRLEHLLTMTMGVDWAEHEIGTTPPPGVDRFGKVLEHPIASPPGSTFVYAGRGVDLLAGVLLEATGMEADRYAETHLFAPLGIDEWDWSKRRWRSHPDMSAALELRPRDMAKLGQLVLDEGSWQGRQVVSAEWIQTSTRTHVPETPHRFQYGYLWWRVDPPSSDLALGPLTFANGIGSQFIVVAPERRLVVVVTGGNPHNGRQFDIVRVVDRQLVPGIS